MDNLVFEGSAPLTESKKRSLALIVILLVLIYIGSTMIPNIWTTFKFTGATTAYCLLICIQCNLLSFNGIELGPISPVNVIPNCWLFFFIILFVYSYLLLANIINIIPIIKYCLFLELIWLFCRPETDFCSSNAMSREVSRHY